MLGHIITSKQRLQMKQLKTDLAAMWQRNGLRRLNPKTTHNRHLTDLCRLLRDHSPFGTISLRTVRGYDLERAWDFTDILIEGVLVARCDTNLIDDRQYGVVKWEDYSATLEEKLLQKLNRRHFKLNAMKKRSEREAAAKRRHEELCQQAEAERRLQQTIDNFLAS